MDRRWLTSFNPVLNFRQKLEKDGLPSVVNVYIEEQISTEIHFNLLFQIPLKTKRRYGTSCQNKKRTSRILK